MSAHPRALAAPKTARKPVHRAGTTPRAAAAAPAAAASTAPVGKLTKKPYTSSQQRGVEVFEYDSILAEGVAYRVYNSEVM
jgi:hypothetical protein